VSALKDGNPDYKSVKVLMVNWDIHKNSPIRSELEVRRRSTLISFKDGKEIGRVIAQTSAAAIEPLFADALVNN